MAYLGPDEVAAYGARRSAAKQRYGVDISKNRYDRGQAKIDYRVAKRNMLRDFGRQREALPGQYVGRGLMNSGIYKQGLANFAQDKTNNLNELLRAYQRSLANLRFGRQGSEADYQGALAAIRSEEAARRAAVAASLRDMGIV